MQTKAIITGVMTLFLLGACGDKNRISSTEPASDTAAGKAGVAVSTNANPEQLGEIGAQLKAHPQEAEKILSRNGMDEASFEQAIRKVSSDPALSRRYAAAYKKARA